MKKKKIVKNYPGCIEKCCLALPPSRFCFGSQTKLTSADEIQGIEWNSNMKR